VKYKADNHLSLVVLQVLLVLVVLVAREPEEAPGLQGADASFLCWNTIKSTLYIPDSNV